MKNKTSLQSLILTVAAGATLLFAAGCSGDTDAETMPTKSVEETNNAPVNQDAAATEQTRRVGGPSSRGG